MPTPDPIEQFAEQVAASLTDGPFVRLVLSRPVVAPGAPEKVLGRGVTLASGPHLSLTFRYPTRDVTKNLTAAEAADWVRLQLGRHFHSALLGTTERDWQFVRDKSGTARLVNHQPVATTAPPRTHDQPRTTILDTSARDWLRGLGVVNAAGQVRPALADKYAQINRYLEIFSHLARECGWINREKIVTEPGGPPPPPPARRELTLADMGCGKGYLTFGVWHLLHRIWHQPVRVLGVETRDDLVAATNDLARRLPADGLEFQVGTIESAPLPPVDALIALHACNTATDDAIRRGIDLGAHLIVLAPCCHKELRPQLDAVLGHRTPNRTAPAEPGPPAELAHLLRHGVMAERMAEWATDGLRALFLEWAGYSTKIFEFVPSEHTPKNLMIAAVRRAEPFADPAARERIAQFKRFFGFPHHALDPLLTQEPVTTPCDSAVPLSP